MLLALFEPERVELRLEMAADAIGADEHQGAHRIERCAADFSEVLWELAPSGWRRGTALPVAAGWMAIADHARLVGCPVRPL